MDNDLSPITAIILAAGQGTRMKSSLPKVLHQVTGKPLVIHALENVKHILTETPVLVIGHEAEQVRKVVGSRARYAEQRTQLGTADAVKAAQTELKSFKGLIVVVSADMPLFTPQTLQRLVDTQRANPGVMSMLSVCMDDPHGFGRVVRKPDGSVQAIVEEAQADAATLLIKELNVGAYCFRSDWLWGALERVKVSPMGEYYLTDTVALAVNESQRVECLVLQDASEAVGINTRIHLAEAEKVLRHRINQHWMLAGVTMIDPETTYIDLDVLLSSDIVLEPNCHLHGTTRISSGCRIGTGAYLQDVVLEKNCILGPGVILYNITVKENQTIRYPLTDNNYKTGNILP